MSPLAISKASWWEAAEPPKFQETDVFVPFGVPVCTANAYWVNGWEINNRIIEYTKIFFTFDDFKFKEIQLWICLEFLCSELTKTIPTKGADNNSVATKFWSRFLPGLTPFSFDAKSW